MKTEKNLYVFTGKITNARKIIQKLKEIGVFNEETGKVEYDDDDTELVQKINKIIEGK